MKTKKRTWEAALERYKAGVRTYKVRLDEIIAMYGGREKVAGYGGLWMVASGCYVAELEKRTAELDGMAEALGLTKKEIEKSWDEIGLSHA